MKKKMGKKGISPVIASILLVMLTVASVGLIAKFLLPMAREKLSEGKSCFELIDYFEVVESDYTCYNSSATSLMIERGMEEFEVEGFAVSIYSEEKSKRYDVKELTKPGEAKTYVFDTKGANVKIAAVAKGKNVCEPTSYTIPECKR